MYSTLRRGALLWLGQGVFPCWRVNQVLNKVCGIGECLGGGKRSSILVFSQESLWLRSCVFTLGQLHIPPSYALFSLCTDAAGNRRYRCPENAVFRRSARRSSAETPRRQALAQRPAKSVGSLVGIGGRGAGLTESKGVSERREGCRHAVGGGQGWRTELEQHERGRDGEFGAIGMGGTCSSLGSGWEPLRSLGVSQPLLGQRAARLAGDPGWFGFFPKERESGRCGRWRVGAFGPQHADLAGLKHRRVQQPSCPARAKRRLFVHDGRFRAGTGRVGSGQRISLP